MGDMPQMERGIAREPSERLGITQRTDSYVDKYLIVMLSI